MSKIIAKKAYLSHLPNGEVAVSFVTNDMYSANLLVNELENLDKIDVTAKAHKSSRSLRQNAFFWLIIEKISKEINGIATHSNKMLVYKELLIEAQTKYEYVLILPEAVKMLESQFRAVIPTNQTREVNGKELMMYQVFIGSSKMNTKEMTQLIDVALNYASDIGIVDSEIESMRVELYE